MSEQVALAVIPQAEELAIGRPENAADLMRRASDVAGVCREIVTRTAMELQGKKYIRVEGWQSMATAFGCSPSIREVVEEERGIRAVAELRRHDGAVLATAEGFVGFDEPRWASQALYAQRGMAQTRAISRVCRNVFAFVVVLIDENLQTTPAEEVPDGRPMDAVVESEAKPQPKPAQRQAPAAKANGTGPVRSDATKINFGKNKNKYLCDVPDGDLSWILDFAKKSVDNPHPNQRFRAANEAFLKECQAEAQRRIA